MVVDDDQTRGRAVMSNRKVASGFQILSVRKDGDRRGEGRCLDGARADGNER